MRTLLITKPERERLLANGKRSLEDPGFDPWPVVKLFTPDGAATWLLSELDPEDPDLAFGLCDLGLGFPELGGVLISELLAVRGRLGLPVERDRHFEARKSLSAYTDEAFKAGRIVA